MNNLEPGDSLLYYGDDVILSPRNGATFVDWLIAVKTGYWLSHVEIYAGEGMSYASRNGIGVNLYKTRQNGLKAVRRPLCGLDLDAGEKWFNEVARGQEYDFKGLLCFYLAVRQGSLHKMFCSEFQLRFYRTCKFHPVSPEIDADRTPPSMGWISPAFITVWKKPDFEP
jgi:hypothetical protein